MKRRILSVILAITLLLTFTPSVALATGETLTFSTTASSSGVKAGDTFDVTIKSKEITGAYSGDLKISFDKTVFNVTAITWNTSIPGTAPTTVTEANNNGFLQKGYTDNTDYEVLTIPEDTLFVTATFKVLDGAAGGTSNITLTQSFTNEYSAALSGITANTSTLTVTVLKAPITSAKVLVDVPVKGEELDTTVNTEGATTYTAAVAWYEGTTATGDPVTGTAKANQVYTAQFTLTPKTEEGENFANNVNVSGTYTGVAVPGSDGKLVFTKTFTATAPLAITSYKISGDTSLPVTKKQYVSDPNCCNYTFKAVYEDLTSTAITSGVTWSIDTVNSVATGCTVKDYKNGVAGVTAPHTATAGTLILIATYNETDYRIYITVTKDTPKLTAMTIGGAATIAVPKAAESAKTESCTLSGEDQYGAFMTITDTVTWSIPTTAGVSIDSATGVLTVTSAAAQGNVTITASVGSGADTVTASKTVSITRETPVPTSVTITGGVSSVNVPEVETLGTLATTTTAPFTATVYDQYGVVMTDQSVTWSVLGSNVSMTSDGELRLTSGRWGGSTTVKASVSDTVYGEKTVTINRDQLSSLRPKFVEIYKDEAKVTEDSIVIPSGTTPNTASYTAKVYDQYGVLMSEFADLNWSLSSTPTGVTLSGSTVTVASSASATTEGSPLVLTATAGTGTSAPTATVSISIANKQLATVTINGLPTPVTYGTEFTLTASAKDSSGNALTGGTWTWSYDTYYLGKVSEDGASITLKPNKAGDFLQIKATYEDDSHLGDKKTTFTVAKKTVTVTVTAPADYKVSKIYDGTTDTGTPTGSLTVDGILSGDAVTVKATPAAYANANVHNSNVAVNLELEGDKKNNYKLNAASVSVPCEITAKELTNLDFTGVSVTKVYDTTTSAGAVSGTIGFDGKVGSDDVSIKATAGNYTDANVGTDKTVTLTLALEGTAKDNYKLNSSTYSFTTASITKATYSGTFSKTVDIVKGRSAAQTGSLTADDFLATPPAGAKIKAVSSGTFGIINSLSVATDGTLSYTSNIDIAATADESYTVTISSTNYNDFTATLIFRPTDKETQAALTINSASSVTYGQTLTLSTTGGSSGGAVTYTVSAGTGAATVAGAVLTPTKAGTVTVMATMAGDDTYEAVSSAPFTVTIAKATPTGTPSYTGITSGGKTLADAALGIGSIAPTGGTIAWNDPTTTVVAANTAYGWTYTPADAANYNTLTGTLTLYHVSTGGGGGSASYAISVDKAQNGSITVSPKSASKGDTVTITVAPDKGYTLETLTVLDKNGKEITVTAKDGKYTFTMPASKVTVKGTFAEDNSMLNFFTDVPADAYYYDAVKWAVENGITNGINATEFGPDLSCTRAQIVTFLWRAAGCPEPKSTSSFSDVPADAFYAKAVAWAVENGITGGIGGNKFAPDETCTRAQSATFLYRAAGCPAVSGNAEFSDVGTDAYYANAVAWAAKEGITGGIGGGLFGSELDCTRAQIVTFLYRSIVK